MPRNLLSETPLLDYSAAAIQNLIMHRNWKSLPYFARIGAVHDFVRDEILFGYNSHDAIPASRVLAEGYGQCNTKTTLLMALFRALGIPCRFHGFTIDKRLQRGIVPELMYAITPRHILHSWVEIAYEDRWVNLEGFILDTPILIALQTQFPNRNTLCAYGVGTDRLQNPEVTWAGESTYIQITGIDQNFDTFDNPDTFYATHRQLSGLRGLLYRGIVRHWMNRRVARMRHGHIPKIPGGEASLLPALQPAHQRFNASSSASFAATQSAR